jgi:hypothetical protein
MCVSCTRRIVCAGECAPTRCCDQLGCMVVLRCRSADRWIAPSTAHVHDRRVNHSCKIAVSRMASAMVCGVDIHRVATSRWTIRSSVDCSGRMTPHATATGQSPDSTTTTMMGPRDTRPMHTLRAQPLSHSPRSTVQTYALRPAANEARKRNRCASTNRSIRTASISRLIERDWTESNFAQDSVMFCRLHAHDRCARPV